MEISSIIRLIDAYNLYATRVGTIATAGLVAQVADVVEGIERETQSASDYLGCLLDEQALTNDLLEQSVRIAVQQNDQLRAISRRLSGIAADLAKVSARADREERAEALKELLYVMEKYQEMAFETAKVDWDAVDVALGLEVSPVKLVIKAAIEEASEASVKQVSDSLVKHFSRPVDDIAATLEQLEGSAHRVDHKLAEQCRLILGVRSKAKYEGSDRSPEEQAVVGESILASLKSLSPWVRSPEQEAKIERGMDKFRREMDAALALVTERGIVFERAFGFRMLLRTIACNGFTTKDLSSIEDKRYFDVQVEAARERVRDTPRNITEQLDRMEKEYALYQEVAAADITLDLPDERVRRPQDDASLSAAARAKHNSCWHRTDHEVEIARRCVDAIAECEKEVQKTPFSDLVRGFMRIRDDYLVGVGGRFGRDAAAIKYSVGRIVEEATDFRAREAELVQRESDEAADWNSSVGEFNSRRQALLDQRTRKRDSLLADMRCRLNEFLKLHRAIQDFLPLIN